MDEWVNHEKYPHWIMICYIHKVLLKNKTLKWYSKVHLIHRRTCILNLTNLKIMKLVELISLCFVIQYVYNVKVSMFNRIPKPPYQGFSLFLLLHEPPLLLLSRMFSPQVFSAFQPRKVFGSHPVLRHPTSCIPIGILSSIWFIVIKGYIMLSTNL